MIEQKEIYRGRKFDQVCHGARRIFLRDGFEGASVDDIARAANVSKATLYSYFPHKRLMFHEIMSNDIRAAEPVDIPMPNPALPAEQGLGTVIRSLSQESVSELQIGLYRMAIAEASRFPDLSRAYHERIPARRVRLLAESLTRWSAGGELVVKDAPVAATHLWRLTGGALTARAAMIPQTPPDLTAIREICDAAIAMFLRAHAATG